MDTTASGSLALEIRFGPDPDDILDGASVSWVTDGVEPEDVPTVTLQAVLGLIQMRAMERLRQEFSFGNEEILSQMAEAEARLILAHTVMHVPLLPMTGTETVI